MFSRTLAALFRPATALVGRLRYAHKFVVVGIVLLVPLGLVADAYVGQQRAQIDFSTRERAGVAMLVPLITLTSDTVRARHEAAGGGRVVDLTADLAAVDEVDRRLGLTLNASEPWLSARTLVAWAARDGGPPADRFAAYNWAIDGLLTLIVQVGDESNLTLDPDLDSYYLMDLLQFELPVLLDTAGHSVDRVALEQRGSNTGVLIDLGVDNSVLTSTRKAIGHAGWTVQSKTSDAGVRQMMQARLAGLDADTEKLGAALAGAVKARDATAISPDAAVAVRASATQFAAEVAVALDRLLVQRIAAFAARAQQVELVAGLAALLGIYLFVGFYLSVARPIRRIVATLHAVAGGDLTRRVSIDTHDELSFVARTLNETVARTEVATERLADQATHDTLTRLPNRGLVLDRLGQALTRAAGRSGVLAVLFIDLDRFKLVNDSLGHETGDVVLCTVAARLTALVSARDTVGRLSGDEFVVICEDTDAVGSRVGAMRLGERVVAALSEPIPATPVGRGRVVSVGASVGVALFDGTAGRCPEDLLRDADVAMYQAKQRGRGRVEIFDDALRVAAEHRVEVHSELRRAIEDHQVVAHYQPIVDARTGEVIGFEALARWAHPTRGLLGADAFIEIAEQGGLIVPLGAAILAQACAQTVRWRRDHPDLHVAVNVSAAQFDHPSFVATVATVLTETGLDPNALWLEITETSVMADAVAAGDTLRAIRALGVHLAIDDFGTGYSSLAHLRRFPVEALKIDRSFVSGLDGDRTDQADEAIVAMILSLARTLDLVVIAEGVETAGQLAQLTRLGCVLLQGYLLGRPLPADEVWRRLQPLAAPAAQLAVLP